MSHRCAKCGKQISSNVYYCSNEEWYLCWDDLHKAALLISLHALNVAKQCTESTSEWICVLRSQSRCLRAALVSESKT